MSESILHIETSQSSIKALLYYDIFNYPLLPSEVYRHMETNHTTPEEIAHVLDQLTEQKIIYKINNFYSLQNQPGIVQRRLMGNKKADDILPLAKQRAEFIQSFPFVRAVFASGSLSKNFMDDESDLDFFVVTAPGRLWIARTLLIIYKRLFLFNSHRHFCINYFVDEEHLEIEEKNIYTATELATLLPLTGIEYQIALSNSNTWIDQFLPNHKVQLAAEGQPKKNYSFKNKLESLIEWLGGERLDIFFMNLTARRWKRLYGKVFAQQDFDIAFKSKRHVSKNHPRFYQKKVTEQYREKTKAFCSKFNFQWIHE